MVGIGDGDWGLGPIPNPQSPIPNQPFNLIKYFKLKKIIMIFFINNKLRILLFTIFYLKYPI